MIKLTYESQTILTENFSESDLKTWIFGIRKPKKRSIWNHDQVSLLRNFLRLPHKNNLVTPCNNSFLGLQEFVRNAPWLNQDGQPMNRDSKRRWLNTLTDNNQSDLAGISYCPHSDLVEFWFTKLQPFKHQGIFTNVPGIRTQIASTLRAERLQNRRE